MKNLRAKRILLKKILNKEIFWVPLVYLFLLIFFVGKDFFKISIGEDFIQFLSHYSFTFKSLISHNIPFWSPYSSLGIPELFDSDFSYFYPGIWLVFITNVVFNHGLDLNFLGKSFQFLQYAHLLIGQLGMYFLLRRKIKLNWSASLLGGLVYGLSPFSTWDLTVVSALNGKMFFPILIFFLLNFIEKNSFKNLILFVLSNVLLFSFGYPYHMIFIVLSELVLALLYGFKIFFRITLSIFISALLASFFLVPNLYYLVRASGSPYFPPTDTTITSNIVGQTSPARIINILNPQVYSKLFDARDPFLMFSIETLTWGVIPLIFLLVGFASLKNKKIDLWLVLIFVGGIIFSLNKYLNVPAILELIPFANVIRSVQRVLILPFFAGTILLAIGADKALKGIKNKKIEIFLWLLFVLLFTFLILSPIFCTTCTTTKADLTISLGRTVFLLGLGLLLYYLTVNQKRKIFIVIIIVITLFEFSFYYKSDYRPVGRRKVTYSDYLQRNSLIPEIPTKDNLFRYYFMDNQFAYNSAHIGVFNIMSLESIPSLIPRNLWARLGTEKTIKYANVKYFVVSDGDVSKKDPVNFSLFKTIASHEYLKETFISSVPGQPFWSEDSKNIHYIYKVNYYFPRFFVPIKVQSCSQYPECFKDENPPDLLIVSEPGIDIINPPPQSVKIQIISYATSNIKLSINANKKTFISSSEAYDKGWQIKINNKQSKIYTVSDGFRGFILNKGHSEVEMYYIPQGLRLGILLSFFGILSIVFIFKNKLYF